ncbi:protein phosphatase 2C domain-containing protein [Actinomyces sp.]|uniref:PP2C family protein-serine/threonine phosphatase n=1 Tax=Actinomyces sp. TaxID=29317 RepID=UPI00289A7951|nr:protein phosphatase 2C domain-containing protein [Actinomyces sp.]
MPAEPVEFRYAARSDVGLTRRNNQDSGYAGPNLLVLADGMGGPAGGDIASSVALAHLVPLDSESHPAEAMLPLLRAALNAAHEDLTERSAQDSELKGLGTTCIAIMRAGNKLAMVHIGDSRAYLLRGDTLTQVTTDHSFVQYLVDTGQITPEEAEHHPQRNVVLRVLGDSQADVTPDETVREAILGDRWLLCSDGLSGVVSAETIGQVLSDFDDPGACAEELIHLALLGGGPDNVTCVIADVVPSGTSGQTAPQIVGAAAIDRSAPSRGGTGAAARAAALANGSQDHGDEGDNEDEDEDEDGKHRWWAPVLTLLVAALVAGGGWLGYLWTQTQYFAIGESGSVVIYQGIPQTLGPWSLSHRTEVTDISLSDLSSVDRERLREPVVRSSREEIDAYVTQLEDQADRNTTPSPTPSPSASPSASPRAVTPAPTDPGYTASPAPSPSESR